MIYTFPVSLLYIAVYALTLCKNQCQEMMRPLLQSSSNLEDDFSAHGILYYLSQGSLFNRSNHPYGNKDLKTVRDAIKQKQYVQFDEMYFV